MSDKKRLMILIAVMTLLRCATAACAPLIAGEAYYWLWGKHLAAGYFDHPPMVGVMSALFFGWIDGSELVARSGPIILGMITTLLLYLLGEELFPGQRAGWRAALAYSLIPICDLNSLFIGPDNSLALFTVLTWYLFWRAANRGDSWGLWIGAGAAAGLSLLSKFHAWVLLPPLYLFLMLSPAHRGRLRHGGPWLAIAVALIVLSPNLYWNAKHGWMNYVFQWHRSSIPRSHFDIKNPAIYFLGPLLGLSPLAYTAMVWGTYRGYGIWRHRRDAAVLFLLCAGLPLVLFLGALSFAVTISLHWPGVGQLALILLSIGLMGRNELFPPNYFRWMVYVAGAMTLLLHAAPFFLGRIPDHLPAPFGLKSIDSTRLKEESAGWPEIGRHVAALRDRMNEQMPTVIMAKNWHTSSMLAFYSGRVRDAFVYGREDAHNFELWRADRGGLIGADAVVVIKKSDLTKQHAGLAAKYDKYHRILDPLFERVEEAPSIICYSDGAVEEYMGVDVIRPRIRELLIFKCYGYNGKMDED